MEMKIDLGKRLSKCDSGESQNGAQNGTPKVNFSHLTQENIVKISSSTGTRNPQEIPYRPGIDSQTRKNVPKKK